jgi:DNA-binding NtrC family response regulator
MLTSSGKTFSGGVLIASSNGSFREQVLHSFQDRPCTVQQAFGGADALVKLETGDWQVLFLDRRLPDLDAEELQQIIRQRFPGIEVVLLDSDSGSAWLAAGKESWQLAHCPVDAGGIRLSPATEASPRCQPAIPDMIGSSEAMQCVYRLARLVAQRMTTVLILGESGTGKELVARGIHRWSQRSAKPFVVVNCAAIPESLLESELFGYTRGAFTGAVQAYSGRIQAAHGGSLFLDEIGELPLSMQAKLLRFLEYREVQRLGSTEPARADVRILAASNVDLQRKVEKAEFREDLYYRLSAFPLALPPLSERRADIVPLALHFIANFAADAPAAQLSAEAAQRLQSCAWRGNVRELQHVIERALILAEDSGMILPEHLVFDRRP